MTHIGRSSYWGSLLQCQKERFFGKVRWYTRWNAAWLHALFEFMAQKVAAHTCSLTYAAWHHQKISRHPLLFGDEVVVVY